MKLSLFKRQALQMAAVMLVFLSIGLVAGIVATQLDRQRFEASPTRFFVQLVDSMSDQYSVPREKAVQLIKASNEKAPFPADIDILTRDEAQKLIGVNQALPGPGDSVVEYGERNALHFPLRLMRLNGPTEQYLSVNYRPRSSPLHRLFNPYSGIMMLSIFLGSMFSLFVFFYSMRSKARLAAQVISEMRDGNLNARFPVGKMDDVGHLMAEFNKMADEIQQLVETIRSTELVRIRRLQELAHDLRTPVASLKNLLETLQTHNQTLKPIEQEELLSLSLKEVDYFARLVEDLLFLAQVAEPKYSVVKTNVDLIELLSDEIETLRTRYPKILVSAELARPPRIVRGDAHLLRRLFRNALENAFSFSRAHVDVRIHKNGPSVVIWIADDGKGFNESTLATFGEKRGTRVLTENSEARLSVGLGSVIMKAVVQVHGGSLTARNRAEKGAEVEVVLPMET